MIPAIAIIPAFQAESSIFDVVQQLHHAWSEQRSDRPRILVVDDGSTDGTSRAASNAGAEVVRHAHNQGKGAALTSGLRRADALGALVAVALDADRQHPPQQAVRLLQYPAASDALILGTRDLAKAGAPRANRFSNQFSNVWLSLFCRRRLLDTQCGLRRYPVKQTLMLDAKATGFAFEAEVVLRAARAGFRIEQVPIEVLYPPAEQRTTHFHSVRDPFRIVLRVVYTAMTVSRQ